METRKSKSVHLFKVALIQINAGNDWRLNLKKSLHYASKAACGKPRLIAFPENFLCRGGHETLKEVAAKALPCALSGFSEFAKEHRISILLGSIPEKSAVKGKFYNSSYLISERGDQVGRYRKIHLFDIDFRGLRMKESKYFLGGSRVVTSFLKPLGIRVGLSICYDLRFPELYRRLATKKAGLVFVPANFTYRTGEVHWETLLRARAIENQVFIAAPAQVGVSPGSGIRSFGTSMIIDPWGKVLAKASHGREEILFADLDFWKQKKLHKHFPVLNHRRLAS